ncbi:MAG: DNA primase [Armatimonadetes bacterium]|nr:DNA primase [Armatimonadota bacterium]
MNDERQLVRSRVSLVELVSQEVRLKKTGKNWTGLCPFHDDKHPSFTVSDVTGTYRCWSCGAKGDVFTWMMERRRLTFREALEELAKQAGIKLSSKPQEGASKRGSHIALMEAVGKFFKSALADSARAQKYCSDRGIDANTIEYWELGFAEDAPDALPTFLKKSGFALADAKELFVVDGDSTNGYGGKFRDRLMFPIRDERGVLVAYGGRIIGDGRPKYINSSDTPLFRKSRVLYGLHQASSAIAKKNRAILVEGYLDVIACHRAGLQEAVASLGTSLTEEQAKMLKRWCDRVVVLYDRDAAGQKAAERASELLAAEGIHVSVCLMPEGQDPDSVLRSVGPAPLLKAVEQGISPLEFRIQQIQTRLEPTDDAFWTEVTVALTDSTDVLEIERQIERLAPLIPGLRDPMASRKALRRMIQKQTAGPERTAPTRRARRERFFRLEMSGVDRVLLLAAVSENFRHLVWPVFELADTFSSELSREFAVSMHDAFSGTPPEGDLASWVDALQPEDTRYRFLDFVLSSDLEPDDTGVADALKIFENRKESIEIRKAVVAVPSNDKELAEIGERLRRIKRVE